MLKKVTVIYPTGSFSSGIELSHYRSEPLRMRLDIEIENHYTILDQLETIWRYMNHVDGSPVESQLVSYKQRSMMVGDMAEVDGKTYIVNSVGWYLISSMGITEV